MVICKTVEQESKQSKPNLPDRVIDIVRICFYEDAPAVENWLGEFELEFTSSVGKNGRGCTLPELKCKAASIGMLREAIELFTSIQFWYDCTNTVTADMVVDHLQQIGYKSETFTTQDEFDYLYDTVFKYVTDQVRKWHDETIIWKDVDADASNRKIVSIGLFYSDHYFTAPIADDGGTEFNPDTNMIGATLLGLSSIEQGDDESRHAETAELLMSDAEKLFNLMRDTDSFTREMYESKMSLKK